MDKVDYDLIIIGGAGITAGIYTARARPNVLIEHMALRN